MAYVLLERHTRCPCTKRHAHHMYVHALKGPMLAANQSYRRTERAATSDTREARHAASTQHTLASYQKRVSNALQTWLVSTSMSSTLYARLPDHIIRCATI
jgi:ribosomal protein L44E